MRDLKIGVAGAGLMGAEIALVFALSGAPVVLVDQFPEALDKAAARLSTIVGKGIAAGRYEASASEALTRITFSSEFAALAQCNYLTEAVFENQDIKVEVLKTLADVTAPGTLIATNTSTIPISTLATAVPADRRGDFIGTHYFSPVSRMQLVEIIPGFETRAETVAETKEIMAKIGKVAIDVKDVAGFAVNRMLHAMIIEAVRLVEEGVVSAEDLDIAAKLGLGHAIGPFALMDAVSLKLSLQAQEIMQEAYGERFRAPPLLKQMVRAGFVGGKGNPGWHSLRRDSL